MAGSVNKVILIGNLGRDPEVRRLNNGEQVCNLRLATTETWRDKASGERKERTEWHQVVIFNENLVRVAEQYLKKGSKVYVEGQLQTRKWTDQSGVEKYSTEVVLQRYRGEMTLLDGRGGGGAAATMPTRALAPRAAVSAAARSRAAAPWVAPGGDRKRRGGPLRLRAAAAWTMTRSRSDACHDERGAGDGRPEAGDRRRSRLRHGHRAPAGA